MTRDAHHAFLVADRGLAAFQTSALASIEAASLDALCNALLLDFAALVNSGGMALHRSRCRCCLCKAKG